MRYLESKGARVPALGLGTQGLLGDTCIRLVRCALEVGYRFVDTSEEYGNELEIGRAIRESGVDRGEVFLATKVSRGHLDRPDVRRACEASLARLGTGYADLLLVHWPDPRVPLA
ncbi:MAG TPA: aldo/keto reductase, partial [Pseudonocardiaceae bacterium]|nr:aldo/keto reductase [Pseudonocardiaceae bacterium]